MILVTPHYVSSFIFRLNNPSKWFHTMFWKNKIHYNIYFKMNDNRFKKIKLLDRRCIVTLP